MNVTYVTGLYKIYKENTPYQMETLISNVKKLLSLNLKMVFFVDDFFHDLLFPSSSFSSSEKQEQQNLIIIRLPLHKITTYQTIIKKSPQLPDSINGSKDTVEYMALMNSKVELLHKATHFVETEYVAWIDAGIFKILNQNFNPNTLTNLNLNYKDKILLPGATNLNLQISDIFKRVYWNYLGGFFILHIELLEKFYKANNDAIDICLAANRIAWEVNVWCLINQNKFDDLLESYTGDHNNTIFDIPPKYCQNLKERVTSLRFAGKNEEAYNLARTVLENEKDPFSSTNEDLSIVSYYVGKKEEGRIAIERILHSEIDNNKKSQALNNLAFYATTIKKVARSEVTTSLPENYFGSSPSIIPYCSSFSSPFSSDDQIQNKDVKYLYNLRAVNYKITPNGSYDIKDPNHTVRTKNFLLFLDENFKTVKTKELSDDLLIMKPKFPSHVVGLEDIRLFSLNSSTGRQLFFFATNCETLPRFVPRIVFGKFNEEGELLFVKPLYLPDVSMENTEKNWLPFVASSDLFSSTSSEGKQQTQEKEQKEVIYFIYSFNPLKIYRLDEETGKIEKVVEREKDNIYEYRGSAPPIRYGGGWLMTIHQVLYSSPRKYYHRLVWYNDDFTETRFGPLFYFEKIGIEYTLSVCKKHDSDDILMTYSVNDGSSKLVCISKETIEEQLSFSDYLKNNYLYDYSILNTNERKVNKNVKICLAMIVKEESKIIERCMKSCLPILDYISICDTGSTDNTVQIIEDFCLKNNIPGKVHHQPWKNFGHNRTLSYITARETFPDADYCLLIDADMCLKILPDFNKNTLDAGGYLLAQNNGTLYYFNTRLLSTKYNWKCVGVTHEYWSPESSECVSKQLHTLKMDDFGDGGAKADKFERDIKLLTQGLIDEPNNERYMFYLGNSYHDIGKYTEAMKWYRKRIKAGGWFEEVYYAYYRIARCKYGIFVRESNNMKENKTVEWEDVERAYIDAWENCKSRMEPLYEIGKWYQERERYPEAFKWLKKASVIPFPSDQVLFLSKDIYEYRVWDALGIAAFYVGEYQEAVNACLKALKSSYCNPGDAERIKNNMKFSLERLRK